MAFHKPTGFTLNVDTCKWSHLQWCSTFCPGISATSTRPRPTCGCPHAPARWIWDLQPCRHGPRSVAWRRRRPSGSSRTFCQPLGPHRATTERHRVRHQRPIVADRLPGQANFHRTAAKPAIGPPGSDETTCRCRKETTFVRSCRVDHDTDVILHQLTLVWSQCVQQMRVTG